MAEQSGLSRIGVYSCSAGGVPLKIIVPVMSPARTSCHVVRIPNERSSKDFFIIIASMENNQRWFLGQAVCELFHKDGYLNLWQAQVQISASFETAAGGARRSARRECCMAPFWFKRRARSDAPHLALPNSRLSKPAEMLTARPWIWVPFHGSTGGPADAGSASTDAGVRKCFR